MLYAAKAEVDAQDNEEFAGQPRRSSRCSTRPSRCSRRPTASRRAAALTGSSAAGTRSARSARPGQAVEDRLRKVETAVRKLDEDHWQRNNPEKKARSEGLLGQLQDAIAKLEAELAEAKAAGDAAGSRSRGGARGPKALAEGRRRLKAARALARTRPTAQRARHRSSTDRSSRRATEPPGCRSHDSDGLASRRAHPDDLPLAELCAARLDGELFAIGDGSAPSTSPTCPELRAMRAVAGAPGGPLIAERHDGGLDLRRARRAAAVAQFCVPLDARVAVIAAPRTRSVREVAHRRRRVVWCGGDRCTTRCAPPSTWLARPDVSTTSDGRRRRRRACCVDAARRSLATLHDRARRGRPDAAQARPAAGSIASS